MRLIPLYFFITLFIGFLFIYTFKDDYYVIIKKKNCNGSKCLENINN